MSDIVRLCYETNRIAIIIAHTVAVVVRRTASDFVFYFTSRCGPSQLGYPIPMLITGLEPLNIVSLLYDTIIVNATKKLIRRLKRPQIFKRA